MTDHDDPGDEPTDEPTEDDESLVDGMRGSGVGVEDPNIVGDANTALVDEQIAKDEPPQV